MQIQPGDLGQKLTSLWLAQTFLTVSLAFTTAGGVAVWAAFGYPHPIALVTLLGAFLEACGLFAVRDVYKQWVKMIRGG